MNKIKASANENHALAGGSEKIFTVIGVILLLFVIIVVWLIPRASGDLFISLAAGRDIAAGRLAAPDDWSFSTNGNIWLNQNWGAGAIFYAVYSLLGENGLLGIKFIILASCALFLYLYLRRLKAPPSVSILTSAIIVVSMNLYATLRPNLFLLALLPLLLWLLLKTDDNPHLIWVAGLVAVLWANVHASFIFGLGAIWLWAIVRIVPDILARNWKELLKRWPLLAGAAASVLLSGLLNPFGFTNLTLPFSMTQDGVWQMIADWRPIWETDVLSHYITAIINFLVIVAVIILLLLTNITFVIIRKFFSKKDKTLSSLPIENSLDLPVFIFELVIATVAIIMAVRANRFILLALVAIAPILGRLIVWGMKNIRYKWIPLSVLSALLFTYAFLFLTDTVRNYDKTNPIMNTGSGTLFEKMHYAQMSYDDDLVDFINENRLGGNVINPWEWEGYLRWTSPQLRMFVGGRAQQAYAAITYYQFLYLTGNDVSPYHGQAPEDLLDSIDAQMIIVGNTDKFEDEVLTAFNCGNWAIVYSDDRYMLFINTDKPANELFVEKVKSGEILYGTPAITAMSRASFLLSRPELWNAQVLSDYFTKAFDVEPTWLWGYKMLFDTFKDDPRINQAIVSLLENRLEYLMSKNLDGPDAKSVLYCRNYIAESLASLTMKLGMIEKAMYNKRIASVSANEYNDLIRKWSTLLID
jgi:hypothetical protein